MSEDLDLARTIRPGLDILGNEIIIALKKRTRFPQNHEVYEPGLVVSDRSVSLLEHGLARMERLHAGLGRYTYASQEAFTDVAGIDPIIDRPVPPSPIRVMRSGIGDRLIAFYRSWIEDGCAPGSDSDRYGETITADVSALLSMMERVNLGKFVAEAKFAERPDAFRATGGDRDGIVDLIVRRDREAEVFQIARSLAEHYDFDADQAERTFGFMIGITIDIEVDYIRRRLEE